MAEYRSRPDERPKLFVSPIGWPLCWRVVTVTPADKPPLVKLNTYPRQAIGIAIRLPDEETISGQIRHHQLSLMWSKPARWWR